MSFVFNFSRTVLKSIESLLNMAHVYFFFYVFVWCEKNNQNDWVKRNSSILNFYLTKLRDEKKNKTKN